MAEEALNGPHPASEPVVPFRVLDTATRKRAGVVYLVVAALAVMLIVVTRLGTMWLTVVLPLVLVAVLQFAGGWKLRVTDMQALAIASEHASFAVGHASGTLGFRGLLAKPVWQILVFAAGPAPDHQAIVTVDGLTGDVLASHEEAVPVP